MAKTDSTKPGVDQPAKFPVTDKNKATFRTTMVLAAVYGVIILATLVFANTAMGKFLVEDYYAFTLTMVLGMLFIVLILIFLLMEKKKTDADPETKLRLRQAAYACPDFYKMDYVTDTTGFAPSLSNLPYINRRCVADANMFDSSISSYYFIGSNLGESNAMSTIAAPKIMINTEVQSPLNTFVSTYSNIYVEGTPVPQPRCNEIFPDLLASVETEDANTKEVGKELRCAYAKQCGVTWSSLNC